MLQDTVTKRKSQDLISLRGLDLPYLYLDIIPHTLSVVKVNFHSSNPYYGFLGPKGADKIYLLTSQDLESWNVLQLIEEKKGIRWPSVVFGPNKIFWMVHTANYRQDSYIVMKRSNDGVSFSKGERVVFDSSSLRDQNPYLYYDNVREKWILYWFKKRFTSPKWQIWVKCGTSIQALSKDSGHTLLDKTYPLAAPSVFYNQHTKEYILQTEAFVNNTWQIQAYTSSKPDREFSPIPRNPLYTHAACPFPYVEGDILYNFLATYFPPISSPFSPSERIWDISLSQLPLSSNFQTLSSRSSHRSPRGGSIIRLVKSSYLNFRVLLPNLQAFLRFYKD